MQARMSSKQTPSAEQQSVCTISCFKANPHVAAKIRNSFSAWSTMSVFARSFTKLILERPGSHVRRRIASRMKPGSSDLLADQWGRSEERRVGEEGRSRWAPYH